MLTAEGGGTSGQSAILDMVAALAWAKNNIAHFGGDPNQVMLFGQSAGSFNIQMMLAITPARGLFNVAGMESGASPDYKAPWLPTQAVADAASAPFVAAMGCANAPDVLACLRAVPADTMVTYNWNSPFVLGPGIGSTLLPVDSFTYLQQHGSPVPLLIGTTREEYLGVSDNPSTPLDVAGYTAEIHNEFDQFGVGVADQVLSLYPAADYDTPEYALDAVHSDYQITCEIRNTALAAVGAQRPPLWRYLYTHRFENSAFLAPYRAFHTAELFFIFGNFSNIAGSEYFPSTAEADFSQAMMGYWTRFAATGNPNGDSAVQWPPYDSANESMLQLDETFTPINGYHIPQCSFLATLPQPEVADLKCSRLGGVPVNLMAKYARSPVVNSLVTLENAVRRTYVKIAQGIFNDSTLALLGVASGMPEQTPSGLPPGAPPAFGAGPASDQKCRRQPSPKQRSWFSSN